MYGSEGEITDDVQNQSLHVTSSGVEPSAQGTSPGVKSTDQSPANESNLANQVETPTFGLNQLMSHQVVRPKLPKLVLNKFKGNVTHWVSFWDSYKTAVHENPVLSTIDKFNYLNTLLEGVAARSIQGLSLTADNYNSAVEILHKRFGRTEQIIITSHMDELLKLPACTNDRTSSLRYIYDQISVHIRGLASLGVSADQYGSLLIPAIMEKLPSDIRLHIAGKATGEVWKIDKLLEANRQVQNFAKNQTILQRTHYLPVVTSHVYCHAEHYSASCTDVPQAKDRKEILRKTGRCFVCLKTK